MGVFDQVQMGSIILRVADVEGAVAWYRDVLGLQVLHVGADGEHPIAALVAGNLIISLWQLPAGTSGRPDNEVCPYPVFVTADLDSAHEQLVGQGVATTGIRESANMRFFQFEDPDGNRWELSAPVTEGFAATVAEVVNTTT